MTCSTNARIAGVTFLLYFAAGIASMKLAHAASVLTLLTSMSALVLGVTLYALTREEDADLALLVASALLVVILPLQIGTNWTSAATWLIWMPAGVFELILAAWLLIKGVATPRPA